MWLFLFYSLFVFTEPLLLSKYLEQDLSTRVYLKNEFKNKINGIPHCNYKENIE